MDKSAFYCVTHKPISLPAIAQLEQIQVGSLPENFSVLRDNSGDNIAHKNPNYSELTAFYWVWKNRPSPAVGFCHYRRYLLPPPINNWANQAATQRHASGMLIPENRLFAKLGEEANNYVRQFEPLLEQADIVLPRLNPLPAGGFFQQYAKIHPIAPLLNMIAVIAEMDNSLGMRAHNFFINSKQAFWNNMFVTHWPYFDDYCAFLFEVMFRLEKRVVIPDSGYQQRVFAFLSERLFNFWLALKKPRIALVDWCVLAESLHVHGEHSWQPPAQK